MISIRYAFRQPRCSHGLSLTVDSQSCAGRRSQKRDLHSRARRLKSLPVSDPKTLFRVGESEVPCCGLNGFPNKDGDFILFAYYPYRQLRDNTPEFEQFAASPTYDDGRDALRRGSGSARVLPHDFVSGNYLTTLGITPDDALNRLACLDAQRNQTVELGFFSGLSIEESAALLDPSPATIKYHRATAGVWLHREMRRESYT